MNKQNKKAILLIAIVITLQGCSPRLFDCSDEVKKSIKSPDGRYTATSYERDCGATTLTSTIINLRPSSMKFNPDEDVIFVAEGQFQIRLVWENNFKLRVECSSCLPRNIFVQKHSWYGVEVLYPDKRL